MPTRPDPVVTLEDVGIHFHLQGSALARLLGRDTAVVKAVDGVNLEVRRGEVLGLVGESGSGKTTLGRALLGLVDVTEGAITYHPADGSAQRISTLRGDALRRLRTRLQMVFQDPHAALNPSMTIETAVGHPLRIHGRATGADLRSRVAEALETVGLSPASQFLDKLPTDLSGGQKQRAVLARAIILGPELLVADEPVSMLDMSVRAKILELMLELKGDLGLTYVYITHDLATAKFFCDRVAIMYLGKVVEIGPTAEIFANPRHPYTKALLKAIPEPDPSRVVPRDLPRGEIPDAARPPLGCSFHPRCPVATVVCGWEARDVKALIEDHWTRVGVADFERERQALGDLTDLERTVSPGEPVLVRTPGAPAQAAAILERVRSDRADSALWAAATVEQRSDGLAFTFTEPAPIRLLPAGEAEVACVHFDPAVDVPTAD